MKPAWTTFSQRASALAALALLSAAACAQASPPLVGYNEVTLAGLRPGRDSLSVALKRYKAKYSSSEESGEKQWTDPCTGHTLTLKADAHGVIQEITVSALEPIDAKCEAGHVQGFDEKDWITGHGLHLGDPQDHISELYGEPNSSGPAVKSGAELEFLLYPFGSAGSDVPQAMEIFCARDTGKVVEITLAFQGL